MFRASIIPYMISNGDIYFGFGLDSRYKEIADFGGRVDFYDKDHYSTALREFQEETSSPIDFCANSTIELKNDNHQIYICKTENYVMHNYIQHISNIEVNEGFIIDWNTLMLLLNGGSYKGYKMWESLREIINTNINTITVLLSLHPLQAVPLTQCDDILQCM